MELKQIGTECVQVVQDRVQW